MREFINLVEAAQVDRGFSVSPEQAQKILSSRYLNRGVKIGKNTRLWRGVSEDSGSGMATYGTGLYFTANRKRAKIYGEVIEIGRSNLPDNPFRFDTNNNYEIWLHETREILGYDDMRKFATAFYDVRTLVQAIDPSADGIQVMTGADAMFVVYPSVIGEQIVEAVEGLDIQTKEMRGNRYSFRALIGGEVVATGEFQADQYGIKGSVEEITVSPNYRRQGIATAIYDHFDRMGFKVIPSDDVRPDGQAFWNNRGSF